MPKKIIICEINEHGHYSRGFALHRLATLCVSAGVSTVYQWHKAECQFQISATNPLINKLWLCPRQIQNI